MIQIILDNIRSTHNVGSIFRTSDAAGVSKILLCGITPSPVDRFGEPNSKLTKVSLGAENSVAYEKVGTTNAAIKKLKAEGFEILALEQAENSINYKKYKYSKKQKVAIVLGTEVEGLKKTTLTICDKILEIPMQGEKESLNVAVAYGILIFSLI